MWFLQEEIASLPNKFVIKKEHILWTFSRIFTKEKLIYIIDSLVVQTDKIPKRQTEIGMTTERDKETRQSNSLETQRG